MDMTSRDLRSNAGTVMASVPVTGSWAPFKPDYEAELKEMTAWLEVQMERLRPVRDLRSTNLTFKYGRLLALLGHMQLPVQQTERPDPG